MTDQADQKDRVRQRLERIWKFNEGILRNLDHELIVLAVPTYPANIEAVSSMDLSDIADVMATFAKKRIADGYEQVEQVQREGADDEAQTGQLSGLGSGVEALPEHERMGTRYDGGRAPEERAEPPAEPNEGKLGPGALGENDDILTPPLGEPIWPNSDQGGH